MAEGRSKHVEILIRVSAVCMEKAWVLSYPLSTHLRLLSDKADAQAGLSLCSFILLVLSYLSYHGSHMECLTWQRQSQNNLKVYILAYGDSFICGLTVNEQNTSRLSVFLGPYWV